VRPRGGGFIDCTAFSHCFLSLTNDRRQVSTTPSRVTPPWALGAQYTVALYLYPPFGRVPRLLAQGGSDSTPWVLRKQTECSFPII